MRLLPTPAVREPVFVLLLRLVEIAPKPVPDAFVPVGANDRQPEFVLSLKNAEVAADAQSQNAVPCARHDLHVSVLGRRAPDDPGR